MEQLKKHLKISSIVVLFFTLGTVFNIIAGLMELDTLNVPEGAPVNTLMITQIILIVVSAILILPQIYIGFKGLKIAKKPNSSKSHIVVAIILFIFTLLSLLSSSFTLIEGMSNEGIGTLLGIAIEASVYFDYIMAARAVAKEN